MELTKKAPKSTKATQKGRKVYENEFGGRIETQEVARVNDRLVSADMENTPEKGRIAYLGSHISSEIYTNYPYLPVKIEKAIAAVAIKPLLHKKRWQGWEVADAVRDAARQVLDELAKKMDEK